MNDIEKLAEHATDAASLLKVLANENRLMICCMLLDKELSVTELNELIPLSQSALSQHLAKLRELEILMVRREAQTIFYRIENDAALKVIQTLKSVFCP